MRCVLCNYQHEGLNLFHAVAAGIGFELHLGIDGLAGRLKLLLMLVFGGVESLTRMRSCMSMISSMTVASATRVA